MYIVKFPFCGHKRGFNNNSADRRRIEWKNFPHIKQNHSSASNSTAVLVLLPGTRYVLIIRAHKSYQVYRYEYNIENVVHHIPPRGKIVTHGNAQRYSRARSGSPRYRRRRRRLRRQSFGRRYRPPSRGRRVGLVRQRVHSREQETDRRR